MATTKLKGVQIFNGTITSDDIDDALEKEFTKARVTTNDSTPNFLSSKITAGTNVTLNVRGASSTNQTLELSASSTPPGGSNTQVQYNSNGSFFGSDNFTFNGQGVFLTGSLSQGRDTKALGADSHAEGIETFARGASSHSEGIATNASGDYSHAEGDTSASPGMYSHAEGYLTVASGSSSHSEGRQTVAKGDWSHAEGHRTNAIGNYSHAGGGDTDAIGIYSTTMGLGTIASGTAQTVVGKYNKTGNTDSLFIIGNGTHPTTDRRDIFLVNPSSVSVGSASLSPITFFFVSGTIAAGANSRLAVFGGDTAVSGNLKVEQTAYIDTINALGIASLGVVVNGSSGKVYDLSADTIRNNSKIYSESVLTLSGTTGNKIQASGPMYGLLGNSTSAYGRMPLVITSSYANASPASAGVATTVARPTVPASTLASTGDRIRCTLEFTAAANANNKQIILQYGLTSAGSGTQFLSYTTQNNGGVTILNFSIVRTGASSQIFRGIIQDSQSTTVNAFGPINGSTAISNSSDCDLYIRLNNTTTANGLVLTAYSLVYESNS